MAYKITGKVAIITPTQSFKSRNGNDYTKRDLVITAIKFDQYTGQPTEDETNTPIFTFIGEKCKILDPIKVGDTVTVHFDLSGRRYDKDGQTSYINDIRPFNVIPQKQQYSAAPYQQAQQTYTQQTPHQQASSQPPQTYQPPYQSTPQPFGQNAFPSAPMQPNQGNSDDLPF